MNNILPIKKKTLISEILLDIDWDILEDGSVWYKIGDGEWIKLKEDYIK
jgi:hypothetical protein